MLRGRRRSVEIDGRRLTVPAGVGVAVYETRGRVVVRAVDASPGPSIERSDQEVIDGHPGLDPARLGAVVVGQIGAARLVELPERWPPLSEYAHPLLAVAPARFRSHRAWQRASRHVSVSLADGGVTATRLHADLGRGAWMPAEPDDPVHRGFAQRIDLESPTTSAGIGAAVLELLRERPIAG